MEDKMSESNLPKIMILKEIAAYLRVDEETILLELESDRLHGFKVGDQWRCADIEILAYINGQTKNMESALADSEQGFDQNSDWEIRTIEPFDFSWPQKKGKSNVEHYDNCYEATGILNGQQIIFKIGFGYRFAAGQKRRRVTIWFGNRSVVEFASSNNYENDGLLAGIIKLRNGKQLTPLNRIPQEYNKYKIRKYNLIVKGPRSSTNMAIIVHKDDIKSMVEHAFIRSIWRKIIKI
jgi:hypothetical protein